MPIVARMRTHSCLGLTMIHVRFVPSAVRRLVVPGIGFHNHYSEWLIQVMHRITFAGNVLVGKGLSASTYAS